MRVVAISKRGSGERPTRQAFGEGDETIIRALTNKRGLELLTETSITGISRQTGGSFELRLKSHVGDESVSTRSLILATPTDVTGKLLSHLDSSFATLLAPIEYAAVAVVSLGYYKNAAGHPLNGFGFLVPRSAGLRVLGSVWNSSLFPGRAPEGKALLTSFVGGTTDSAAANLNHEELVSLVHR